MCNNVSSEILLKAQILNFKEEMGNDQRYYKLLVLFYLEEFRSKRKLFVLGLRGNVNLIFNRM